MADRWPRPVAFVLTWVVPAIGDAIIVSATAGRPALILPGDTGV
jgi:hypothetical protein